MKERTSERIEYINSDGSVENPLFDLSKSGIALNHESIREKGAIVKVSLNDVELEAKVVYCQERKDGYRLGMQFLNITADKQKIIEDLTDKFSKGVPINCRVLDEVKRKA